MKRKILSLLLGLSLCLPLLPAALADEAMEFTDVPSGSWFEQGVKTCSGQGVMVGTGEGVFSPDAELSQAECLTLAYRLYDLGQGGDGSLLTAPEDWGKMTLTLADGTVFSGYSGYNPSNRDGIHIFRWWSGRNDYEGVCAPVPGIYMVTEDTPEDQTQWAWLDAHPDLRGTAVPATMTLNGVTYQGTANCWMPVAGYELQFQPEPEKTSEVNAILHHAVYREVGPDKWWRNVCYTIHEKELEDVFDPADFSDFRADREFFARALASAAGELEKRFSIEALPDLDRECNEDIYALYEAGILTGTDEFGTFQPDKTLTRAEAAVMVSRVLDPSLRIGASETPAAQPTAPGMTTNQVELEVNRDFSSYDEALEGQRHFGYHNERLFDTDICTVVVNDYGGMMHAQKGVINVIYKSGSAQGDGAVISPPHPGNSYSPLLSQNPDSMELSEDKKTFTYTYIFDEELVYENVPIRGKGTFTYVLDLPSGKVSCTGPTPSTVSYADALAKVVNQEDFTVERTLESPYCTIVLGYYTLTGEMKNYAMYRVYKAADTNISDKPEGTIQRETLSYTNSYVDDPATGHVSRCTDRTPDTLVLSKDGSTLFFSYDLGDGPLTELTGGGVHSTVRDLPSGNMTWYTPEETVDVLSKGTVVEKKLENDDVVALLVYDEPYGVRDYALYLIGKDTGLVRQCILPSTQVITLSDGSAYAPTTLAPNRMALSYSWLGYHYRFDAPLGNYHDAGLYSYDASPTFDSVQHYSGQYDRAFEEYWLDKADILFETPECSVLQTTSWISMAPPSTVLSLLYKPGSAMGEGIHIALPILKRYPDYAASIRHDSRVNPPDSVQLSDDGKTLTYTYRVQWPVTDYHDEDGKTVEYVEIPVGTYTYSVELATGEWSQSYLAE